MLMLFADGNVERLQYWGLFYDRPVIAGNPCTVLGSGEMGGK